MQKNTSFDDMGMIQIESEKQRIDYVDIIKGVSILWVVLIHLYYPNCIAVDDTLQIWRWLSVPYRMPSFFFMSGIFFRSKPFSEFLVKKIKTLLLPFLGFWFIGFLFFVVKYELVANWFSIDYREIGNFANYASSLKGLFYLRPSVAPCIVNGPLWFLLVLFFIQVLHFLCCKFIRKKSIIFIIGIFMFIAGINLKEHQITGLFFVANVFKYYIYYSAGSFWGNILMKRLQINDALQKMPAVCLLALIVLPFIHTNSYLINEIVVLVRSVCFIPVIFAACKSIRHFKIAIPLKYCGIHSLEILVTHSILISLIYSFVFNLIPGSPSHYVFLFLVFPFIIALEYFIIRFCNKYLYLLLGKTTKEKFSKKNHKKYCANKKGRIFAPSK